MIYAVQDDPEQTPRNPFCGRQASVCQPRDADLLVLDGVSFDVPPGKITTVVGFSGCGKTTLLRLATGLVNASAGTVICKGVAVAVT